MSDSSPEPRDHAPGTTPARDEPATPPTTPIPLDEQEIRERAAHDDDDDTDSVL
ncbi:hypothetical protein DEU34_0687 [Microbacterium sp. AG1240]|uniref:hypothetical protein n=1 Tax=Microbacterium sp. AG1240 TaxID=2183992 RepID=UPI000F227FD4|nr:hypothetical protein [Microbacterium sp. AG1240]RKT36176.1 hypothetical protein DEU34_0687 [Microbacterium sp. AG1240]